MTSAKIEYSCQAIKPTCTVGCRYATHTYMEKCTMQHTRTWKKTYTGNDRQLLSSHKKIARQNRNVNKTNSSYVN